MTRRHYVFSLLGTDRTGLVNQVTDVIRRSSANLEDSRMAVLGEEFAMMILCSVAPDNAEKFLEELGAVASQLGLKMVPLQLDVKGVEDEGIVNDVVHHLVEQGVSVQSLETQLVKAPYSGVTLFEMRMRVQAPATASLASLRGQLQSVTDELNVDFEIRTSAA